MARSKLVMTVLAAAAALAVAGCGSVAADAAHVSAASGHASATTTPSGTDSAAASPEAVNPGGPLRGVSGLLCSAPAAASQVLITRTGAGGPVLPSGPRVSAFLTSATPPSAFLNSAPPPSAFLTSGTPPPAGPVVKGAVQARALAKALCALPTMAGGLLHCPQQVTASYELTFTAGGRLLPVVIVRPSGCLTVTGAGAVRSAARDSAFLKLLASMAGPVPLPGAQHLPGTAVSGGPLRPLATRG
jgi:hypothetical protein